MFISDKDESSDYQQAVNNLFLLFSLPEVTPHRSLACSITYASFKSLSAPQGIVTLQKSNYKMTTQH